MKKHFLLAVLLFAAISATAQIKTTSKNKMNHIKKGFVHTVEGLQLLTSIKEIQEGYVGVPASTRRSVIDHTYTYSLTFVFKNKADHDVYQEHPTHKKFIERYSHLWARVQVYDATSVK